MAEKKDAEAPHGYEEDGTPKAPYGWTVDGRPRRSNRGRMPTKKSSSAGAAGASAGQGRGQQAQKARSQRENLLALADAVISPLMAAASSPAVAAKVGQKRADGAAGSLFILEGFMPAYADQVVTMAQTRPGLLTWMDRMDDKAPLIGLGLVTVQALKAIATNMANPDPRLAEAARLRVLSRNAQMAQAAEDEARRLGISLFPEPEPVRPHPDPTDRADVPRAAGVPV